VLQMVKDRSCDEREEWRFERRRADDEDANQ
jgi:hypothetical protein